MEQTLIHALFHVIDMGGDEARNKADLLGAIIMSNRFQVLTNHDDMTYVEGMIVKLQARITEDLTSEMMDDKDTHEELIHAYVSLSKALEYARLRTK